MATALGPGPGLGLGLGHIDLISLVIEPACGAAHSGLGPNGPHSMY